MSSSGTANKSVSEGRDEQDDEQSVKEEPFGANINIHTLNSFCTASPGRSSLFMKEWPTCMIASRDLIMQVGHCWELKR